MGLPKKKIEKNITDSSESDFEKSIDSKLNQTDLREILSKDDFEIVEDIETNGLNITMPKDINQGESKTRVRLIRGEGKEEELSLEEARNFLQGRSKEIQKIIIEKIRPQEADRVSLLIGDVQNTKEEIQSSKKITQIDEELNGHFLDKTSNHKESSRPIEKFQDKAQNNTESELLKIVKEEVSKEFKNSKAVTNKNVPAVQELEEKSGYVYRQRILVRKKVKKGSDYFYKTTNHLDLYNIGQSYKSDFDRGVKNFAFISSENSVSKEKTVLGLCSFFNYHFDVQITIVVPKVEGSFYYDYIKELKSEKRLIEEEDISFIVYYCDEFQLIEFEEFNRVLNKLRILHLEDFLDEIVDISDIVLWDLPDTDSMGKNRQVYFPATRRIDNVSIVMDSGKTKLESIHKLKDYFKKYGIPIKGILMNNGNAKKKDGNEE